MKYVLRSAGGTLRTIHRGSPWPLGSTITPVGVNFSVAAPSANRVELLIFSNAEESEPEQTIELEGQHQSGDYWHIEVEGLGAGCCYGYRVFGPLEPGDHGFRPAKVLVDPCARAIDGWGVPTGRCNRCISQHRQMLEISGLRTRYL